MINFFIISAKFNLLRRAAEVLDSASQIQKLQDAGEEVTPELKTSIAKGEELLSKILGILLLRYPESVVYGLLGGMATAYFIMLYYG
jgi:hypothetical protein